MVWNIFFKSPGKKDQIDIELCLLNVHIPWILSFVAYHGSSEGYFDPISLNISYRSNVSSSLALSPNEIKMKVFRVYTYTRYLYCKYWKKKLHPFACWE